MSTFRLHIQDDFQRNDVKLFLVQTEPGGHRFIGTALVMSDANESGSETPADGRILPRGANQRDLLQAIVDGAWEAGFRPSGYGDIRESLAAIDAHLQDMRALAFHATGVQPPTKART